MASHKSLRPIILSMAGRLTASHGIKSVGNQPTRYQSTTTTSVSERITALEARIKALESQLAVTKIPRRALGHSGLQLPIMSLGCAGLGNVYGDMTIEEARFLVHTCVKNGVDFFDTSPYYGDTKSEDVLGECLKDIPRESFILATKCGRSGSGSDFSRQAILKQVEASLNRLQVDTLDILQLHDIEFSSSLGLIVEEALPALQELKDAGKVKAIGITGLPLNVLDFVHQRSQVKLDCMLSYCCYTLNNTNLKKYLRRWNHNGIGVIQGGAASMGLLSAHGPPDWHPAPDKIKETCRKAVQHVESKGKNISKLAFQYVMREELLTSTLVGVTNIEQLTQNLKWVNQPDIDNILLEEVMNILDPIRNQVWVEKGSEENIALSYAGYWAKDREQGDNTIIGSSKNLSS